MPVPRQPESKAPTRPSCGNRLDQPGDDDLHRPSPATLDAQQRLLGLLSPQHPAEDASRTFTDLRLISALLCMSWPLGRDLMDPRPAAMVDNHVAYQFSGVRPKALDKQPASVLAAAGLLTAAVAILDGPDLAGTVARHVQAGTAVRPSRLSWSFVLDRHRSACSPAMREAAEPATRAYRRAPVRTAARHPPGPAATGPSTSPRSWSSSGTTSTLPRSATGHR